MHTLRLAAVACALGLLPTAGRPDDKYVPTADDLRRGYERADRLAADLRGRVFRDRLTPHWLDGGARFWYRNDDRGGKKAFVLVDCDKGERGPAFDHAKLAESLSKASGTACTADRLPFDSIEYADGGKAVRFAVGQQGWRCDLTTYECVKAPAPAPPPEPEASDELPALDAPEWREEETQQAARALAQPRAREPKSPDGKWTAFVRDNNVFVRAAGGDADIQLSKNGEAGNAFDMLAWSPDSKALVGWRVEPGERKEVYLFESSPRDGGRARMTSRPYPLPGDKFTAYELWVFDPQAKTATKAEADRVDFGAPRLRWHKDGRHFTYEKTDRGHQRFRIIEVDAHTGKTRTIVDDKTETFIWTAHGTGIFVNYLDKTDEILYGTERDGWRHLYLIDAKDGKVKNRVTEGKWVVRGIDRVDEDKRQVWFRASGKNAGQDPYFVHYYRVNFDGSGLVALTAGDGQRAATRGPRGEAGVLTYSPDRRYLIDSYSRVDLPPVHELRRVSDGSLVCLLERADASALTEAGWRPPEVFVARGRDGTTDIWGIVCRPSKFDPAKKYPVIEYIYAGPHDSHVPKTFAAYRRMQSLAELGFIVVQIDGMGTANRSKAFHDVCWHNLADAGFPDRILWIKALAAKYPYVDATRVGIHGTSAGGQNAAGAVLFHPDFYKVAVASCGCHDNRMDKASWNEQWMGYPVGPHYAACSNITNAGKLRGKLLLIVGEMDTNVPPESTLRFADALIKAGKDFDLLVVPGMGHSDGGTYGERRRRDFFVRHLHGVEPPDRNAGRP
jgi:dipeptidyl aminopeptidase/acylaminoacyl peptidase